VNKKIIAKRDGVWVSEFGAKEYELPLRNIYIF